MKIHHIQFLDSVSYMPMPLRKLPETFGLTASKDASFHEGVPQNFGNEHGKPCLIILDELLN